MNGTTGVPESVKKTPSISKTTTSGMRQYAGLTGLEHRDVLEFGDDARARAYPDSIGLDARPSSHCAEYLGRRTMAAQAEGRGLRGAGREVRPSRRRAGPAPGRVGRA